MLKEFLVNVLPVVIAVIAIAVPTWLGIRQTRVSRHTNNIQAMLELLAEFRSASFHDQHDYVCARLQQEHSPDVGVRGSRTTPRRRSATSSTTTSPSPT